MSCCYFVPIPFGALRVREIAVFYTGGLVNPCEGRRGGAMCRRGLFPLFTGMSCLKFNFFCLNFVVLILLHYLILVLPSCVMLYSLYSIFDLVVFLSFFTFGDSTCLMFSVFPCLPSSPTSSLSHSVSISFQA
jgi:hypothetical protein